MRLTSNSRNEETDFLTATDENISRRYPLANAQQIRSELRQTLTNNWTRLWLSVAFLIMSATAGLVTPRLIGAIVDLVTINKPFVGLPASNTTIILLGILMVVAGILSVALSAWGFVLLAGLTDTMIARLRERVVAKGLLQPLNTVETAGSGDLVSRATVDVAAVGVAINGTLRALTTAFFALVVTLLALATLSWQFLLILIVLIPVYWIVLIRFIHEARPLYSYERAERAARSSEVLGSLRGLAGVWAFGLEKLRSQRIRRHSWNVVRVASLQRRAGNNLGTGMKFAELLASCFLLIMGLYLVLNKQVTLGEATAAILFFIALFRPIETLLRVSDQVMSGWASLQRVVGVIVSNSAEEVADIDEENTTHSPATPSHVDVTINGVSFSFDDHEVLHKVDLSLPAGKTVALVGISGAGKSTLASLIGGLRTPTSGSIYFGDRDSRDISDEERSHLVTLLTQEIHVFSGTLREDLTLAKGTATDAELWEVLTRVGAASWVHSLEGGLNAQVGAVGSVLSPMEEQQLALARVLLIDPPVVILDEATAEAGSSSAEHLEVAATEVTQGRTALVIAHRLTQAATSDRVVLMAGGRIIEQGSHEELVAAGGEYAQLWLSWSRGRKEHVNQ